MQVTSRYRYRCGVRSDKLRYSDFAHQIDIDELEAAIGFDPIETVDGEDRGYCPLPWNMHKNGDTTGKFSINREKKIYNCWVCEGGSLLSLAMAMKDLDVDEATEWLHQFSDHEDMGGTDELDEIDRRFSGNKTRRVTPYFNVRVLDKWHKYRPSLDFSRWVSGRGISWDSVDRFHLCCDLEHTKRGKAEPYTGPAIILPHFWDGKLVGWQQRWLDPDRPKWLGKYTNTGDFPREWTVWGYDEAIKAGKVPLVVESVSTALRLWSIDIPTIATFGSNINDEQVKLLRGFIHGVKLAPDNDHPGEKWLDHLADYLERYVPVAIVPPQGKSGDDLGDLSTEADIRDAIEQAMLA